LLKMQLYPHLTRWTCASRESTGPDSFDEPVPDAERRPTPRHGSVMIVEDDDAVRDTLADILEYEGYTVFAVNDGREALASLHCGSRPALILLDLMMPRMNGWEFRIEQLRSPEIADIPVAILSGAFDVRVQAALLGVREFLGKPVEVQRLLDLVRRFCG